MRFGSNTGRFCGLRFGSNTGGFCSLCLGGNTSGLDSLCLNARLLDQQFVDDDGFQFGSTLLHDQRSHVQLSGRAIVIMKWSASMQGIILCTGRQFMHHDRRSIRNGSGGSSDLRLSGNRGGLGCLWLDSLSLFFLAAETQPGKQTFCHLKNTHFVG
ncbi:hypothetical protein WH06_25795 [Aeromonas salmonicida subsp. salmonicida]|nr:hypothetical protein WH06_25795 [Aeromonas salmonicida subsp. salmonicida]